MSLLEVDTNKNIVRLERNGAGMFQPADCCFCFRPTQHRCTFPVIWGKFYDVRSKKRICGKPHCNLCLGEVKKKHLCPYHSQKDDESDNEY